eukprot:6184525-Pleurochrysis_carterae.AAC.1
MPIKSASVQLPEMYGNHPDVVTAGGACFLHDNSQFFLSGCNLLHLRCFTDGVLAVRAQASTNFVGRERCYVSIRCCASSISIVVLLRASQQLSPKMG